MNIFYLIASGIGITCVALMMVFIINHQDWHPKKWTIWHGLVLGAIAAFVAITMENYMNLFDYIYMGLFLMNWGAALFAYGMLFLFGVVAYNMYRTGGKTAVL